MDRFIFNSGSIFHLHQLETYFRHRGGRHFHLADTDELLELLRVTSHSRDRIIQRHFRQFWRHLDPDLVAALREGGVADPEPHGDATDYKVPS